MVATQGRQLCNDKVKDVEISFTFPWFKTTSHYDMQTNHEKA